MFGVQAYQQVATITGSPWELVDKLYECAIKRIDEGQTAKAMRIVEEGLLGCLRPDVPMAKSFAETYNIILQHLLPGGGGNLKTAREMLVTLREGWQGIKQ